LRLNEAAADEFSKTRERGEGPETELEEVGA